jgi:hypothetical protein
MLERYWRVLSDPQRLRDAVSRRLSPHAFRLGPCRDNPNRFCAMAPDRYTYNLSKYLQRGELIALKPEQSFYQEMIETTAT